MKTLFKQEYNGFMGQFQLEMGVDLVCSESSLLGKVGHEAMTTQVSTHMYNADKYIMRRGCMWL